MIVIDAEYRNNIGTGNSRKLRKQNKCPAIIYGKNKHNTPIIIKQNVLRDIEKTNKLTNIDSMTISVNNIQHVVKVSDIQYHHFKKQIIHIDFIYVL